MFENQRRALRDDRNVTMMMIIIGWPIVLFVGIVLVSFFTR